MLKAGMSCPFSLASSSSQLTLPLEDITGGGCVAIDVTVDEAVIEAAVDVGGGNDLPLVSLLLCP